MFRVLCLPQPRIKGDVIVADLEVFASRDDVCFPSDSVDDQPVTDPLTSFVHGLKSKSFKEQPDMRVGFVPVPPHLFLLLVRQLHDQKNLNLGVQITSMTTLTENPLTCRFA